VVELLVRSPRVFGVNIYSSNTRAWMFKESGWGEGIIVSKILRSVFVNGFMHMLALSQIVVVDMVGKTCRKFRMP